MSQRMPFSDLFMQSLTFGWKRFGTVVKSLIIPILIFLIGFVALFAVLLDFNYLTNIEQNLDSAVGFGDVMAAVAGIFRVSWQFALIIMIVGGWLLSLPLYSAYAKLSRFIGLDEEPENWWLPQLNGPTWRMFFAYLIYTVLTNAMYAIGFYISYLMNGDAFQTFGDLVNFEDDPTVLLPLLGFFTTGFLIGFIGHIIIGTKLAPFTAASACENRLMLINSWVRTKGHFWTILGTYILITLTLMAISTMIELVNMVFTAIGAVLPLVEVVGVTLYIAATIIYQFFAIGVIIAFTALVYRYLWWD